MPGQDADRQQDEQEEILDGQAHAIEVVLLHRSGNQWRVRWDREFKAFIATRNRWKLTPQPTREEAVAAWIKEVDAMV